MAQRPIFWHQGLFLQPQHMQLSDLWVSSEMQVFKKYGQPYFWGVNQVQFDQQALEAGKLTLLRGEFLFRDGTLAVYPDNAVIGTRSLDRGQRSEVRGQRSEDRGQRSEGRGQRAEDREQGIMVYVLLKSWDKQGKNVTVVHDEQAATQAKTKFNVLSNPERVPDTLGEGPEADVQFMRYTLAFRFADELKQEQMEGYQYLPVARLIQRQGKIVLDPDYVPPCLSMEASPKLNGLLNNLTELLVGRSRQLEGYKSPEEVDSQKPDMSYLVLLMALRTLSRYSALCTHLQETASVHPWQVYGVLRQLVAELSTFSLDIDILGYNNQEERLLPTYGHNDLFACFKSAYELALQIVDSIGSGPELLLNMNYLAPFYQVELQERVLQGGRGFWLVLKTESDPDWVFDSVARLLKLSPSTGMTTILSQAVSGIPVSGQAKPPAGLPRQANAFYFRIHTDSHLWADVCSSRQLSMFWDEAPEDLTAQIAVLNRGG